MTGFKKKKKKGKRHSTAIASSHEGIEFKSRLELYCYKELVKHGLAFTYEKKSYSLIEGFKPKLRVWSFSRGAFKERQTPVRPITYTPDFVCDGDSWVIETKGYRSEGFKFRWKLFLRYLHLKGESPLLFMPTSFKEVDEAIKEILKNR